MTRELAEFLKRATEHCGTQEIDVRTDYSGRAMYGRTTFGIVVDNTNELMLNVIQYIREMDGEPNFHLSDLPEVSDMGQLRTDSMGRQTILY